jgi:diguanylate cyclase (GGDEF)-like protein
MIVALSGVMMVIGYLRLKDSTDDYYYRMGETTAGIIALNVNADSLDRYLATLDEDAEYNNTMEMLRNAKAECDAKVLYVFTLTDDGVYYVFDTDTDMQVERGDFDPWVYIDPDTNEISRLYPEETERQLRNGEHVDTIRGLTQYGWTITVNTPLFGSDGTCKGYVGIDFDVNQVVAERAAYIWQLAAVILSVTAIFAVIYLRLIRRTVIRPINIMAKAADHFILNGLESGESLGDSEILSMQINTGDEFQSLAEALKSMVRKIDEHLTNLNIATLKSETDSLTAICNRAAFEQQVTAIQRLRPEDGQLNAFMMIDVDFFKDVNDNYGHAAGDEVLIACAQTLRKLMRESDVIGRLGGDEFAVFCKSIGSVAIAEEKARQIHKEWLKIIPPGGREGITASIGIAFAPQDGQVYKDLFARADEALYEAKKSGRNSYAIAHM